MFKRVLRPLKRFIFKVKGNIRPLIFKSILERLKRFMGCNVLLLRYIGGVFLVILMDFLKFFQKK
jgi:hypothetical protein